MNKPITLTTILLGAVLVGCANSGSQYTPIIDGPKLTQYEDDLAACQQLSTEREYLNGDTRSEAALGAVIGGAVGGAEEGLEGLVIGAALGAVAGGAERAWETRDEKRQIIVNCMKQRGHRVVG